MCQSVGESETLARFGDELHLLCQPCFKKGIRESRLRRSWDRDREVIEFRKVFPAHYRGAGKEPAPLTDPTRWGWLWTDEGLRMMFGHRARRKVIESAHTFFEHGSCPSLLPSGEACHGLLIPTEELLRSLVKDDDLSFEEGTPRELVQRSEMPPEEEEQAREYLAREVVKNVMRQQEEDGHGKFQRTNDRPLTCVHCGVEVLQRRTYPDGPEAGSRHWRATSIIGYSRSLWEKVFRHHYWNEEWFAATYPGSKPHPSAGRSPKDSYWNNDRAYKVIAEEIAAVGESGVTFNELREHLRRKGYAADELKPKYLRGWVERCLAEKLIVCRVHADGSARYHAL